MEYGLYIWSITIVLSILCLGAFIILRDVEYKKSLKGHSLDGFNLWTEQLQSEIDITNRIEEYRQLFMTIVIIVMAYARRIRPYRLRAAIR